jgi:hypothetical protein
MSTQVPFTAEGAIEVAESYFRAAGILEEAAAQTKARMFADPADSGGINTMKQMMGESSIAVMLLALSIELLLKARLHRGSVPYKQFRRQHNHKSLYMMLPAADQQVLSKAYIERKRLPFASATLEDALAWSGEHFVRWRYRHEWQAVSASPGEMLLAYRVLRDGL